MMAVKNVKHYNGRWIDLFQINKYEGNRPGLKGKILLETPDIDYFMDKEQFMEFREKVNEVKI